MEAGHDLLAFLLSFLKPVVNSLEQKLEVFSLRDWQTLNCAFESFHVDLEAMMMVALFVKHMLHRLACSSFESLDSLAHQRQLFIGDNCTSHFSLVKFTMYLFEVSKDLQRLV